MERDGWDLAAMGATVMGAMALGHVGGGVSARWGMTAIERNGRGLTAMAETNMGRVGNGASAWWSATAIVCNGQGLAAMAETAMGRVGNGASARWGATAIVGRCSLARRRVGLAGSTESWR
jgi:hypothetical protein